ncbi:MAG: GNAT family N-acetyltransferase [Verrucomicrobiota bacterium]
MILEDLELAVEWAASEGWNPGLHDAEIFYQTDPRGFFIGKLEDKPVAAISAVRYADDFGFIGFYIVAPDFRDHGYGGHLIQRAAQHLAGCRSIGLDGVEAQQANYARHGARYAHDNIRFEGHGPGDTISPPSGSKIYPLSDLPIEIVLAYDRRHFPADRSNFLNAWIHQPESFALGILQSGKLTGFGVRRRCRSGYKIAPLFADDRETASALLSALRQGMGSMDPFYLDTPETNAQAVALRGHLGMKPVFHTARMYLGETPKLPIQEIYGITSFELG